MLKMYHYAKKGNTILQDGLLGIKKKAGEVCALIFTAPEAIIPKRFIVG